MGKVLPGHRYWKWVVVGPASNGKPRFLECRCDCGVVKDVDRYNLTRGQSKGCHACGTKSAWDDGLRRAETAKRNKLRGQGVEKRKCENCNEEFSTPKVSQRRYCSRACRYAAQKNGVVVICNICGESFDVPKCRSAAKYCSMKCYKSDGDIRKQVSAALKKKWAEDTPFVSKQNDIMKSKSVRAKISAAKKEFYSDPSNLLVGPKNPRWCGGISTAPYCFEWSNKDFKDYIKERDGYECKNPDCWGTGSVLHIHHIDYHKKNCEPDNLITLCNVCNSRANKDREWHTDYYRILMSKMSA